MKKQNMICVITFSATLIIIGPHFLEKEVGFVVTMIGLATLLCYTASCVKAKQQARLQKLIDENNHLKAQLAKENV